MDILVPGNRSNAMQWFIIGSDLPSALGRLVSLVIDLHVICNAFSNKHNVYRGVHRGEILFMIL